MKQLLLALGALSILLTIAIRGDHKELRDIELHDPQHGELLELNSNPPPLASHVMAYHERLKMIVMFGGSLPDRTYSNTLWGWDGESWHVLSEDGPAPRIHAGMAYDEKRDRLVVYGGIKSREESFSDTWEWDGQQWREVNVDGPGPGIRDHHAMAYMPSSDEIILFGGQDENDHYPADTWSLDGERWRQIAIEGPTPRGTHRLTYNSHVQQVMLVGGWGETQFADTWSWDGEEWIQWTASGPSARGALRTAYNEDDHSLILFGGLAGREVSGETWRLTDDNWQLVETAGPSARNVHAMAYHRDAKSIFLYGGIAPGGRLSDLWRLDGSTWTKIHD